MNVAEKKQLFQYINQVSFAVDDIKLYLDTHPEDVYALEYYTKVRDARKRAVEEYNRRFGPLTADQVMSKNYWTWVMDPWPWEREGC